MLHFWLLLLPLALASAIKVPIEYAPTEVTTEYEDLNDDTEQASSQNIPSTTDSYQIRPDDQSEPTYNKDSDKDEIQVPSRYLLPPRTEAEIYSYPTVPQLDQADWTPMDQQLPNEESGPPFAKIKQPEQLNSELEVPEESIKQWFNPKLSLVPLNVNEDIQEKNENSEDIINRKLIPIRYLQPPLPENIPNSNFGMPVPATDLQPPMFKPEPIFKQHSKKLKPILPTISLEMQPPLPLQLQRYNTPTNLYPKKYSKIKVYKPVPIPMHEFQDGDIYKIPKAKPIKYFKPIVNEEDYVDTIDDEKKFLRYQQAQEKRKFQDEEDAKKQQEFVDSTVAEAFASPEGSNEQEASETGFPTDGRNSYAAQLPEQAPVAAEEAPAPAERTEFRMHGLQGPNSYKFGYDTGKGKNRQFRYEERNNDGHVKGHYGYIDRFGKTQVVNYDAHPEHGFHAEGPFGKA